MKKRLFASAGLAALVFAITPINNVQAQCKNRLINKNFACSFKSDSELPPAGETCLAFLDSDDLGSAKFDVIDIGDASLGGLVSYSCACDPLGGFARPRFNASGGNFSCAGLEFFGNEESVLTFPWAMSGRLRPSGRVIIAHQVDIGSNSYLLRCREVPSCSDGSLSVQNLAQHDAAESQRQAEYSSGIEAKRRLFEAATE